MDDDDRADSMSEGRLDGNALGGILGSLFGREITASPGECAHCGTVNMIGAMHAYTRAPGMVLRCPACGGVVLRIVETAEATYVDARGAAYVRFERQRGG